jgi:hypothetical protein
MLPRTQSSPTKEIDMEALAVIATILAILFLIDITAVHKGIDSRDRVGDDWARRTFA